MKKGRRNRRLHPKVWERKLKVMNGISILERQPKGNTRKRPQTDLSWIDYEEEFEELKRKFRIDV